MWPKQYYYYRRSLINLESTFSILKGWVIIIYCIALLQSYELICTSWLINAYRFSMQLQSFQMIHQSCQYTLHCFVTLTLEYACSEYLENQTNLWLAHVSSYVFSEQTVNWRLMIELINFAISKQCVMCELSEKLLQLSF